MSNLVYYVPGSFTGLEHYPDARLWLAIFKIFTDNVSFVDRSGIIKSPIRTSVSDIVKLPNPDATFNLSFDECAVARAEEIYQQHLKHGVPIRVHWSGGIDSSTALMSFIELLGMSKAKEVVEVVMTSNGILENPHVWERVVRKENFKLIHTMTFSESWSGEEIMVNGEAGDQVHGVDIYRFLRKLFGPNSLTMKWTRDLIVRHITVKLAPSYSTNEIEHLADIFINKVQQAPINIDTLGDFWWWLNFSCKWNSVVYRLVAKSPHPVNEDYIKEYFFPFFASEKFQLWSMYKREEKHKGDWESYKWKAKEFVARVSGCPEYMFKHRQGSLYTVLAHTSKNEAIDDNYNFYKNIDPEFWYEPNNSFKV